MVNFSAVMIGAENAKAMGEFYEKVFNKPADMQEDGWYGWSVGNGYIMVSTHSEVHGTAKEPQRVILNFEVEDIKSEFERIKEFATVVKELYSMGDDNHMIATFADPEGNYFQLNTPWE